MNDLEIQRLVDGECSHQQRAERLRSIGDDAQGWRNLALRLLEDQSLRRELRSNAPTVQNNALVVNQRNQPANPSRAIQVGAAMAASLLFLIGGFSAGNYFSKDAAVPTIAMTTAPRVEPSQVARYEDLIPTGRMIFTSNSSGDPAREMPVYEVSNLDPQWIVRNDAKQLDEMNSKLLKRGWNVALDTEIYEGELPDGRRMIVPVKNVNYNPIGY